MPLLTRSVPVTAEKRIASMLFNCDHEMSMLHDLLRSRPLELRPLIDCIAEVKDMARRSAPMRTPWWSLAELMDAALTQTRIKLADVPVALQ